ncbi:MAG: PAS domain-containing protein [Bacteroidia bacterium]|nr:PAS domain-containing protein [Bacteroidia bacterium]MDW8089440.1 PAS domain-containing protein [Bacteroidia bacterium]
METEKREIAALLQTLAIKLANYEAEEASLRERTALLENEQRDLKNILDRFALISETDTRGIITYANPKFCEVSGYLVEELLGKPHNIVRHPDMPKETFRALWETIKAGKIWQGEIKNRRKDGSAYWVLATVGPLLDKEGRPYRYVSIRVDITRQKALEEQLRTERHLLEKDLLENLEMARDLQQALLSLGESDSVSALQGYSHFVLWEPLQMVSGDFYWIHEDKGRLLIFIGDCVGHGVTGGLVSALFLQEIRHQVLDRGVWGAERLAEELDERLGRLFRHRLAHPITIDGSIIVIDRTRLKMNYVALQNKIFFARAGKVEILERYPFSFGEHLGEAVVERTITLEPGDRLYLFSDGLANQLNPEGKRLGVRRLQEILTSVQSLPLPEQKEVLRASVAEWQGSAPPTDDRLVIALEIADIGLGRAT